MSNIRSVLSLTTSIRYKFAISNKQPSVGTSSTCLLPLSKDVKSEKFLLYKVIKFISGEETIKRENRMLPQYAVLRIPGKWKFRGRMNASTKTTQTHQNPSHTSISSNPSHPNFCDKFPQRQGQTRALKRGKSRNKQHDFSITNPVFVLDGLLSFNLHNSWMGSSIVFINSRSGMCFPIFFQKRSSCSPK